MTLIFPVACREVDFYWGDEPWADVHRVGGFRSYHRKRNLSAVEGEFSVLQVVFQRGFLLIDLVRTFGFDYPVVPVIVYEYVLFQDAAHVQDFFLVICPVERGESGTKTFPSAG